MRTALAVLAAVVAFVVACVLSYVVFAELLGWSGRGLTKISAGLAILAAIGGYTLVAPKKPSPGAPSRP